MIYGENMKMIENTIFRDVKLWIIDEKMTEEEYGMFEIDRVNYENKKENYIIKIKKEIETGKRVINFHLNKSKNIDLSMCHYDIGHFIYLLAVTLSQEIVEDIEMEIKRNSKMEEVYKYVLSARILCERYVNIYNKIKEGIEYKQTDFYKRLKEMGVIACDDGKYDLIKKLDIGAGPIGQYKEVDLLLNEWNNLQMINVYKKGRYLYFKKWGKR